MSNRQEQKPALPALKTGGAVAAIVPTSFEQVVQVAGAVVRAGMAPKGLDTTEKATVAIMHGMELGMTPMAALQSIAVINGRPAVWGDGLVALVRASGLLEDLDEGLEKDDKGAPMIAWCKVKRKGETTWKERDLTYAECMRAGWTNKDGPWKLTPGRMMTIRCRTWLLRDVFADVLRGLHSAEEVQDGMADITPVTAPAVEPQRKDFTETPAQQQPSSSTPPHQGPAAEGGQPEGGGDGKGAPSGQPVTDVEDQNDKTPPPEHAQPGQKLEFSKFTKTAQFTEFAEDFLPKTNAEGAKQFMDFYDGTLIAMDRGKPATKEAADWIRATAKEIMEPPESKG